MLADLHVHSTCSDGSRTPEELVEIACSRGISVLSVTDHDTALGSLLAQQYCENNHYADTIPMLIPGIELSCSFRSRDIHLLGYYFDPLSQSLQDFCLMQRQRRCDRTLGIADKLQAAGFPISRELLIESGQTLNRMLIARLLLEANAISSITEAFTKLIGSDCPYYVAKDSPNVEEAIELIASCGGISVVAHPALSKVLDLIPYLAQCGLDGIEAYHSKHSLSEARDLEDLAQSLHLLVTGGSDWHGDDAQISSLGVSALPTYCLEQFIAAEFR